MSPSPPTPPPPRSRTFARGRPSLPTAAPHPRRRRVTAARHPGRVRVTALLGDRTGGPILPPESGRPEPPSRRVRRRADPTPRQATGRASCREAHAGSASPWLEGTQGPLLRVLGGAAVRPRAMGKAEPPREAELGGEGGARGLRAVHAPFPALGWRESSQRRSGWDAVQGGGGHPLGRIDASA